MAEDDNSKVIESSDLGAIVSGEIASGRAYQESEIDGQRETALNYFAGRMPDIPSLPNRSRQISRDVADVIAWLKPGLIRTFVSEKMVEYEALGEENEQWARDASEFMNYDFLRRNKGYRIVSTAIDDALKLKFAILSSWWKAPETKRETLKGLTLDQIAMLDPEKVKKIVSQKPADPILAVDEFGQEIEVPAWDVRVEFESKPGRIVDEACKPENFYYDGTRAESIETARFCGYYYDTITRSDLMEMADEYGFDTELIEKLPAYGEDTNNPVTLARYQNTVQDWSSTVKSGDIVGLYRHFTKADVDGDGIAEQLEVWYSGSHVLAWSVWDDDIPYTLVPCYPEAHRLEGESAADRMIDIQRVKTVAIRNVYDNMYAMANPQQEVDVGSVLNPDVLTNKTLGGIIWKKVGSKPIVWQNVPNYTSDILNMLPYFDEVTAKRVGVSRTTMALDPDTLQNQTATASNNQQSAAYSQIELIARDMAEFGFADFFAKRLRLSIKYYQVPQMIPSKMDGEKYREVNPSQWPDDMPVNINVGLGTGSRDRDMSMLNTIMGAQNGMAQQLAGAGMATKAIEFIPKIRKAAVELTEAAGIRNPESYWPAFSEDDVKAAIDAASQPKPNPIAEAEQAKAQAQMQIEQTKGQIQIQVKQIDAQVSQQESQAKAEVEIVKNKAQLEGDLAATQATLQSQMALETLKQDREDQRFYAKLQSENAIAMAEMNNRLTLEREKMTIAANTTMFNAMQKSEANEAMDAD